MQTVGKCFKWCCVFVSLGGSEQRDFGQTVQDRKVQNQHQPCDAVWKQGNALTNTAYERHSAKIRN